MGSVPGLKHAPAGLDLVEIDVRCQGVLGADGVLTVVLSVCVNMGDTAGLMMEPVNVLRDTGGRCVLRHVTQGPMGWDVSPHVHVPLDTDVIQ